MFAYNLTMSDFDNDTCWFWIKRNDEWDDNTTGCSPVYTCREGKIVTYDFNLTIHTSLVMIRTDQTKAQTNSGFQYSNIRLVL